MEIENCRIHTRVKQYRKWDLRVEITEMRNLNSSVQAITPEERVQIRWSLVILKLQGFLSDSC